LSLGPYLLDINVLLALAWPHHQFHGSARRWFRSTSKQGWATCAVTELGFVRLSSNMAFTPAAVSPQEAKQLLEKMVDLGRHLFYDSPPPRGPIAFDKLFGHKQITDAYLVTLAERQGARFATYDSRLSALARPENIHILQP